MANEYQWVSFYEALADKLLTYKDRRDDLYALIKKIAADQPLMNYLHFEREDWWGPRLHNIDPFSTIGIFNRGVRDENRTQLAAVLATAFEIELPAPTQFAGIPVLNNQNAFLNGMNELWELFIRAMEVAKSGVFSAEFKTAFEKAIAVKGNGLAYITMGLFWIRPNVFVPLDGNSRNFTESQYGLTAPNGKCSGDDYAKFVKSLKDALAKLQTPLTFPQMSNSAWATRSSNSGLPSTDAGSNISTTAPTAQSTPPVITTATGSGFNMDKNILLYGVPGTGKTYVTVKYAVAVIEEKSLSDIEREIDDENNAAGDREAGYKKIFKRYQEFKERGLVEDITFHQSFGYEEFIEGIRPVMDADLDSEIMYEVHNGVFKAFCLRVEKLMNIQQGGVDNFDEVWDKFIDDLANAGSVTIPTLTGINNEFIPTRNGLKIKDTTGCFFNKNQCYNIYKGEKGVPKEGLDNYRKAIVKFLKEKYGLREYKVATVGNRSINTVFIIDEINRGDISKIFGELITLIESAKRIGADEARTVKLAYSGEDFGVPRNVYIIGTMNTADRSIAKLDIALSRRFQLVPMLPDSSVLKGIMVESIDIAELLDVLNARLEALFDSEHKIGHSHFLPLIKDPTIEKLGAIFINKIFPLLQEFFYDDYEKIQLVLGDNRKANDNAKFVVEKADVQKLFGNTGIDFPNRYAVNYDAFKRIEAYEFLNLG